MIKELMWLALAGGLGTVSRYGLSGLAQRISGGSFPSGTLIVNALGCFMFALIWTLAEDKMLISGRTRFIVLTGFMGAFTTFSTFAFETGSMLRDSEWVWAATNVLAQNLIGLACLFLGLAVGRWL